MFSFLPSRELSPEERVFLAAFAEGLNIPVEKKGDAAKVEAVLKEIFKEGASKGTPPPIDEALRGRVAKLQEMVLHPKAGRTNAFAVEFLKSAMKGMIDEKIAELKNVSAKERHKEASWNACWDVLTDIDPHRLVCFIDTVEGCYSKALSEKSPHKEALVQALAKGMVRSMIDLPGKNEIEADEELRAKIEMDKEFAPYMDTLTWTLILSDPLYWRKEDGVPTERYSKESLDKLPDVTVDGISGKKDPLTRLPVPSTDIHVDHKAKAFLERKLFSLIYPELRVEFEPGVLSSEVGALESKSFLLAISAAYPIVKDEYEKVSEKSQNLRAAVLSAEVLAKETVESFIALIDGVNVEEEAVIPGCFLFIEYFIRQAGEQLKGGGSLEIVRTEFVEKLSSFVAFSHEIEALKISPSLKEAAVEMVGGSIEKRVPLEKVKELFSESLRFSEEENAIIAAFPGCLVGALEWTVCVGAVEKLPLPEGMLEILSQPCPVLGGRKVGETHVLVLIPEKVNGQPLTLNSFEKLVSRYFQKRPLMGFKSPIAAEYGDTPSGPAHYVLLTKNVLPGSRNLWIEDSQKMVSTVANRSHFPYEVPHVLEAVVCICMNFFALGTRLFGEAPSTYTRCQEQILNKYKVIVGYFTERGLLVRLSEGREESVGVAALRRF